MKIGVIGCGRWGGNHARTLSSLGVLGAVSDTETARSGAAADRFGCPAVSTADLLGDSTVDGVVVALPPERNAEAALDVLRAGKHLLVEKPMALDMAGADAIVREAEAAGVVAMTGHLLRFHPAFEALEALVANGDIGALRYLQSTRTGLGRFFTGTDVIWDIAPHDLSLLIALAGAAPLKIRAETDALVTKEADIAHLHLTFPAGVKSHTHLSRLSPTRERRLSVVGSDGMAVFDEMAPAERMLAVYPHRVWTEGARVHHIPAEPTFHVLPARQPLQAELEHFLHCILTGESPRSSVAEGRDVLRIIAGVSARDMKQPGASDERSTPTLSQGQNTAPHPLAELDKYS